MLEKPSKTLMLLVSEQMSLSSMMSWSSLSPQNYNGVFTMFLSSNLTLKTRVLIYSINFLPFKSLFHVNKSIIRPCMKYCCHDWACDPIGVRDIFLSLFLDFIRMETVLFLLQLDLLTKTIFTFVSGSRKL